MGRARQSLLSLLVVLVLGAAFAAPANSALSSSWAKLGAEDRESYRWSVKVRANDAAKGPCLLVAASWRSGPLEFHRSTYRECASPAVLGRYGSPLIASATQQSAGASVQMSAVGMIFAPATRRVRITLAGGRTETIHLRRFEPSHARGAELPSFRYAAFAIRGEWCAERLVSLGASGAALWDSGLDDYECGVDDDPHFAGQPRQLKAS